MVVQGVHAGAGLSEGERGGADVGGFGGYEGGELSRLERSNRMTGQVVCGREGEFD